ncbi:hypothetical protein DPN68_08550 [Flavobacterium tibetense]|uniref:Uncharacterized protein n=2 Tax=Flavobacterium tibetense TaxID=2233533 RepID=A0A365P1J1_9FLAO|nr:hypothetical protein DPN68_08550 [Flavobacterium tibetense]
MVVIKNDFILILKILVMYNYLILGLLQILFSFNSENVPPQEVGIATTTENTKNTEVTFFNDDLVFKDELYTAILRVDKQQNETYQMDIQMHLKKGAYFVSPNAKGNFSGRFTLVLTENDKLQRSGAIIETPLSVEEFDNHPFVNSPINTIRVTTNYKQSFAVLSKKDFEVTGYLQFTIEPRCTLEKVPFVLSYTNGKLSVRMNGC